MTRELIYLTRDGAEHYALSAAQARVLERSGWVRATPPASKAAEADEGEPLGVLTDPSDITVEADPTPTPIIPTED